MTCTYSEEANDKLKTKSAVPDVEGHPSACNSQPIKPQLQSDSRYPAWSHLSNATSLAKREHSDPQTNMVTSALSTPEKPATLGNPKVLLRKTDKLLSGKMPRSHSRAEEDSEALVSLSSPWRMICRRPEDTSDQHIRCSSL